MREIKFDHYFTTSEETEILNGLQAKHPDLMKLYSICKTPEGRDIWVVELTNPKTGPMESKPAFHLDGLTHARELTGSMATMYFINYVLENYGKCDKVTMLLDDYAVYAVPCISPDGMDTVMLTDQKPRSVNRPFPGGEQQPGLYAKDMDGDGLIRLMRIKSPFGAWKVSAKDPRFMERRKPDDINEAYYNLYYEGEYVGEYDGGHIENGRHPWDYDFNRNFPVAWAGDAVQSGAGEYPLCNPETKAMAEYILARKNISAVVTCHTCGGVFFYPPGPISEDDADVYDMEMFRALSRVGYEETGYRYCNLNKTDTKTSRARFGRVKFSHGAFDDWMYVEQGILATTIELWNVRRAAGLGNDFYTPDGPAVKSEDENVADWNAVLDWLEENGGEGAVRPWTKFNHPQFGEVEIGGIDERFTTFNPPPHLLEKEIEAATRYFIRYALSIPKLIIAKTSVQKESDGIYRVSAVVANRGYMPTYGTKEALARETSEGITVCIEAPLGLLDRDASKKIGHLGGYAGINTGPMFGGFMMVLPNEPCSKRVSWLVHGKPGDAVKVTAATPKAGSARATVTL